MSTEPTLTADRLREVLDYDPDTGVIRYRVRVANRVRVGDVAGTICHDGYRTIRVDVKRYPAHRLAWLYVYGAWPENEIDHRNGVRDDNRIANLREATHEQNAQNRHRVHGVSVNHKRWFARIMIDGLAHYLGTFDTPEAASEAYLAAKAQLHPYWEGQPVNR